MKKLLIVDDDNELTELLSSYLFSEGFSVNSVKSVESALVFIGRHKPHLIIADIMMKKLNGYDFIKILKKNKFYLDIPLIFLTAKGMTSDRIRGYNLGCHAYITKPFDPKELLAIINNIFRHIDLLKVDSLNLLNFSSIDLSFLSSCTEREKRILYFLVQGYMNKEIAASLNLSLRNVEKYISRLLYRTNTRNRTELVKLIINSSNVCSFFKGE
uniref:TctD transcriptional regulator n=1 Tax=Spermothamnion repens TaxID=31383 RepID=A0A4D6X131_9FLOR|nr:hypothetical protein [Spermothamnion repens]